MWGMNEGAPAEFDLVMRGYDRQQVDRCFAQLEGRLIEALAERELMADLPARFAAARVELDSANRELERLRSLGSTGDARVLSVRMEAILAMAENEAERLRQVAAAELAEARHRAAEILAEADERAVNARRDFELALRSRRDKERHADLVMRHSAEAEAREILTSARLEASRLRGDVGAPPARIRSPKPAPNFLRWVARRRRTAAWAR
ncbi:hypothetical protein Lfu02_37800 [Longispora fulva]|uniref:Vacuolar-type H+-ATPase subunit H n=2 Tax=Longispora fulva TaxID=619741 RepID=A0A8J7GQA2_9ACTN|nr:vacuolar-type H+-ATPase subunit H [Longispora fulva]GIG59408.1 hypothetical protein Lfu02_37800 [Longispora fulva]